MECCFALRTSLVRRCAFGSTRCPKAIVNNALPWHSGETMCIREHKVHQDHCKTVCFLVILLRRLEGTQGAQNHS